MAILSSIWIYPIKSLDGVSVSQAKILPGGSLAQDREFALVDDQGNWVNGKRTAAIQQIRAGFDLEARTVTLSVGDSAPETFHLDGDRPRLESWFSDFFGYPVFLQQNLHMGFPDDTNASGPTVVSVATLEAIATWFPGMTLAEARRRFRANLEIGDVPAFWEDQLLAEPGQTVPFQIGELSLLGSHPCQRCVVPTRDSQTGDRTPDFQKQFAAQRQATLSKTVNTEWFNHFYKLTLNTLVALTESGKVLKVGDLVRSHQVV